MNIIEWVTSNTDQISLIILSMSAVWLFTSKKEKWHFWGYLCGFLSEFPWVYMAVKADQWAVVFLACWWGISYSRGMWNHSYSGLRQQDNIEDLNSTYQRMIYNKYVDECERHKKIPYGYTEFYEKFTFIEKGSKDDHKN